MSTPSITSRVVVTQCAAGICHMQVCAVSDAADAEILGVCNRENPSGTSMGWTHVVRNDEHAKMNPVACGSEPGRTHFLVAC